MSHLNGTMDDLGQEAYATCLYALYDSTDGRCSIVSAGHPPPAVVRPDGSVHFVGLDVDPPLCAADPPFQTTEVTVPAESLLVFYTDGLVRSAERPVDQGMSELTDLLRGAGRTDLDELGAHLVEGLLPLAGPARTTAWSSWRGCTRSPLIVSPRGRCRRTRRPRARPAASSAGNWRPGSSRS